MSSPNNSEPASQPGPPNTDVLASQLATAAPLHDRPQATIGAVEQFASEQSERELTPRERLALQALLDGKSMRAASREAGYADRNTISEKLREQPTFRAALLRAYEENGLTPEHMVRTAMLNLDARQYALSKDGAVVELGRDAHASAKQWDLLAKAAGAYPDPRLEARLELNAQVVVLPAEYAGLGGVSLFGAPVIEGEATPAAALPPGMAATLASDASDITDAASEP